MRVLRWVLAATLACGACAAQAGYNVWTSDYTFTRQELENGVKSRFPQDLRYLQVVEVRLGNPELSLDPARNRIVTKVKAHAVSPFLASPVDGFLTISSGLKYDAAARAVRLDRPIIERVDAPGMPPAYAQLLNDVGKSAAEQALADYPLYTFKPEELQLNGQQFEPGAITVTADGLKVEVRPL
ncbi:MAG TPA: DUF1439 domain-containing protein [Herbaspirillum sp.]|jgi:hypothetical protein